MLTRSETADQDLVAELLAPPDLGDGIEALGYWRQRRQRLPWYRVKARREAERMTIQWEQRVGRALVGQRGAAPGLRMSGGLLLARSRLGRWAQRARIVLLTAVGICAVLVAGITVAVVEFLVHAL
jgi:hypothetical protein